MSVSCDTCGGSFDRIGNHWALSDCSENELTGYQLDMLKGLLMGDAWIVKSERATNPYLAIQMINKEFLSWLKEKLSWAVTDISLAKSAQDAAQSARDTGFTTTVNEENYNDIYHLQTRSLNQLKPLLDWYDSGEKTFPENIGLNSTILKMWYVCDGWLFDDTGRERPGFSLWNERNNTGKIRRYFNDLSIEPVFGNSGNEFYISGDDVGDFWSYVGSPPPGFEYKWPGKN